MNDDGAILALLERLAGAWARGDADDFAAVFSDDADFVNVQAHALRGRAEIAGHHAQLFATIYRGTTATFDEPRIRLLRPDVATIETATTVHLPNGTRHAHMLMVAVHGSDGWALQALHNMIPFTPPAP